MRAPSLLSLPLLTVLLAPFAIGLGAGCGGNKPAVAEATAEAAPKKSAKDEALEAELAKRRAEREAKEAAEKAEVEAKAKAIDELCVLPEQMPKKPAKVCDDLIEAQDQFMQRMYAEDAQTLDRWKQAKGTQLPMVKNDCAKRANVEAAACAINAFNTAPLGMGRDMSEFVRRCNEKFDKSAGEAGGAVEAGAIAEPQ